MKAFIFTICLTLLAFTQTQAQSPDYVFSLPSVIGDERAIVEASLDVLVPGTSAWTLAICSDFALGYPISAAAGSSMAGIDPDIEIYELTPYGVRSLVILGSAIMPVGVDFKVMEIEYSLVGPVGEIVNLEFCEWLLGPFSSSTRVSLFPGVWMDPTISNGQITIAAQDPSPPPPPGGVYVPGPLPGPGDVVFSVESIAASEQGTVTVSLDNTHSTLSGWSLSLCSDVNLMYPIESTLSALADSAALFDVQTWADGVTVLCVNDFTAATGWPVGFDQALFDVTYSLVGPVGTVAPIEFCNTLGNPINETLGTSEAQTFVPDTVNGSILINAQDPAPPAIPLLSTFGFPTATPANFEFSAGEYSVDPSFGLVDFSIQPVIAGLQPWQAVTRGFSMSLQFDAALVECTGGETRGELVSVGGSGPDFFSVSIQPGLVDLAVTYDFSNQIEILIGPDGKELVEFHFSAPSAIALNTDMLLLWNLSPAGNVVIQNPGIQVFPSLVEGLVRFEEVLVGVVPFRRGDVNQDGEYNLADPVTLLSHLFVGAQPAVNCDTAADANASGSLDVSDPIFILSNLFSGGSDPAAPFLSCGVDLIPSPLTCVEYGGCN